MCIINRDPLKCLQNSILKKATIVICQMLLAVLFLVRSEEISLLQIDIILKVS